MPDRLGDFCKFCGLSRSGRLDDREGVNELGGFEEFDMFNKLEGFDGSERLNGSERFDGFDWVSFGIRMVNSVKLSFSIFLLLILKPL